jgi:hypothetical protein
VFGLARCHGGWLCHRAAPVGEQWSGTRDDAGVLPLSAKAVSGPSPLVARMKRLHQVLTGWVIPRVFIVAESGPGSPPPIGIS